MTGEFSDPPSHHGSSSRRSRGIVLAIVLVLIFVLVVAVTAFQRRAIIDTSIASNRLRMAEADALARGGLRIAAAMVYVIHLKEVADSADETSDNPLANASDDALGTAEPADGVVFPPDLLWSRLGDHELQLGNGRSLRVSIEDEGARLNLNALVPALAGVVDESPGTGSAIDSTRSTSTQTTSSDSRDAEDYLKSVLEYIIEGIDDGSPTTQYDPRSIARNLIDYMDADSDAIGGRDENSYYRAQDPPYSARNGPFLSVDEIGLVEGVDAPLLDAMRKYVTVHPIGSVQGINLNRAEPWVLSIVYSGTSGDRELIKEQTVRDIWALRDQSKLLCDELRADLVRCVLPADIGNGELAEGSIYPETTLPTEVSVFRVVAEATVDNLTRRIEAIYDTRSLSGPQLLSWRRLRGPD